MRQFWNTILWDLRHEIKYFMAAAIQCAILIPHPGHGYRNGNSSPAYTVQTLAMLGKLDLKVRRLPWPTCGGRPTKTTFPYIPDAG